MGNRKKKSKAPAQKRNSGRGSLSLADLRMSVGLKEVEEPEVRPPEGGTAPYNFVRICKDPYTFPVDTVERHDYISDETLSGEILYDMDAVTDVFVGAGKEDHSFYVNAKGQYAVPGSTMRGLVRSNVQILGLSRFDDDIEDRTLMFRNVAAGKDQKRYGEILGSKQETVKVGERSKSVTVLKNVSAGYISCKGGKYYIDPAEREGDAINSAYEKNYYLLSERYVLKNKEKFKPLFPQRESMLQNLDIKSSPSNPSGDCRQNSRYKPYYFEISYDLRNGKDIVGIGAPGAYSHEGWIISTGIMQKKKVVYVLPKASTGNLLEIPKADVNTYKFDYNARETTLENKDVFYEGQYNHRDFFKLPAEGETKPVFFIHIGKRLYFGFTPHLRLAYDYSIHDGLPKTKQGEISIDYAQAIFGFSGDEKTGSYKSRVSFADAEAKAGVRESGEVSLVLVAPKPTFYNGYLRWNKDGNLTSYNDKDFRLRGVKQYWLHDKAYAKNTGNGNEKIMTSMRPLSAGTHFSGKIRFHNLRKDELGLLLWALKLNGDSVMNLGMAKSYGYGAVRIGNIRVRCLDTASAYDLSGTLSLDPFKDENVDALISEYKAFINKEKHTNIDQEDCVKDLLAMKDYGKKPPESELRFMELKEFSNLRRDKKALPDVTSMMEKHAGK